MLFKNEQDYKTKRQELMNKVQSLIKDGKGDDAQAIMDNEIATLDNEFEDYKTIIANYNASNGQGQPMPGFGEGANFGNKMSRGEMLNSEDYRRAFMNNVLKGEPIPSKFLNTDAQTTASEVSSVIPTVLVQKIYSKLENVGKFFAMATKTNYKGGVTVPTSTLNLTASWVAERGKADTQEAPTGSVTFAYRKLTCRVAVSFEASVVTLDIFEADFVDKITKAMIKAIEQSMFTGNGSTGNQMKGFLAETPVSGQKIEITEGQHFTYANLAAAEAALPEEYEANAIWVMPKKTFYSEIVGMVDDNGQPIARINVGIDGKPEHTILGRRVEFAPYMSAFATSVTADTIVAAIFDFSHYVINTNYQMTVKKYTDEDTDDQITKALMLVDGATVDKNSLVTLVVKNS